MHRQASRQKAVGSESTSNDQATAIRQQDMARGLSKVSDMEGLVGVAGQVVNGGCLTLGSIVYLQKRRKLIDTDRGCHTLNSIVFLKLKRHLHGCDRGMTGKPELAVNEVQELQERAG